MNTAKNDAFFSPSNQSFKTTTFLVHQYGKGKFPPFVDHFYAKGRFGSENASLGTLEPSRDQKTPMDLSCFLLVSLLLLGVKQIHIHGLKFNSKFAFEAKYEQTISSRSVSHMTLHKGVAEKTMVSFWICIGTQDVIVANEDLA